MLAETSSSLLPLYAYYWGAIVIGLAAAVHFVKLWRDDPFQNGYDLMRAIAIGIKIVVNLTLVVWPTFLLLLVAVAYITRLMGLDDQINPHGGM